MDKAESKSVQKESSEGIIDGAKYLMALIEKDGTKLHMLQERIQECKNLQENLINLKETHHNAVSELEASYDNYQDYAIQFKKISDEFYSQAKKLYNSVLELDTQINTDNELLQKPNDLFDIITNKRKKVINNLEDEEKQLQLLIEEELQKQENLDKKTKEIFIMKMQLKQIDEEILKHEKKIISGEETEMKYNQDISKLKDEIKEHDNLIAKLLIKEREKIEERDKKKEQVALNSKKSQKENQELKKKQQEVTNELQKSVEEVENLKKKLEAIKNKNKNLDSKIESLVKQQNDIKTNREVKEQKLTDTLKEYEEKLSQMQSNLEQEKLLNEKLDAQEEMLEKNNEEESLNLKKHLNAMEEELNSLTQQIESKEKSLLDLKSKKDDLLANYNAGVERKRAKLKDEIAVLEQRIKVQDSKRNKGKNLRVEIERLNSRKKELLMKAKEDKEKKKTVERHWDSDTTIENLDTSIVDKILKELRNH